MVNNLHKILREVGYKGEISEPKISELSPQLKNLPKVVETNLKRVSQNLLDGKEVTGSKFEDQNKIDDLF